MEAAKQLLQKDVCLPLLGPCLLVFSIPLLIPGLTLTLVALWDETGFSRFSGLHVLGMVLLACSGLMLISGVILNCTLTKKAKGRVSPQEEEEGSCFSSSSSLQTPVIVGHVQSTHHARAPHPAPSTEKDSTNPLTPQHLAPPPPSTVSPEGTFRVSSSGNLSSLSPGKLPTIGLLPPLTNASAGSRTSQQSSRPPNEDSGGAYLAVDGFTSPGGSSCNFMLGGSDDEEAQEAHYAIVAAKLRNEKLKPNASVSSSSSSSSQHNTAEGSEAEDVPPHLDRGTLPDHSAVISDERTEEFHVERTSPSSPGHTASSSSLEEESSFSSKGRQRELQNSADNHNANVDAERLFAARQNDADFRHKLQERGSGSGDEHSPNRDNLFRKTSNLQENSSGSVYTESPSHGTYSVRSFASEELAVKASPEDLTEDDVFHPSARFLAESSPDASRSVSPVPLRPGGNRDWENMGITMLGSRSGGSSQSSPEKLSSHSSPDKGGGSRSGSPKKPRGWSPSSPPKPGVSGVNSLEKPGRSTHHSPHKHSHGAHNLHVDSKSKDDVNHNSETDHSERKKKRKKRKKKRRERLKGDGRTPELMDKPTEGAFVEDEMDTRSHRPLSALRSSRPVPHHHSEHHVHWPDDHHTSRRNPVGSELV